MATQKENGHDSDTPPKLQQLPGRSGNKLQGRLYSNAGRGYDRESLQKMSAGAGPALVAPIEQQENLTEKEASNYNNSDDNGLETAGSQHTKSKRNIQHYLSGAALFLAGVIVGNVVIPLFTATSSVPVTENSTVDEISTITSIKAAEVKGGCDISTLKEGSEGCSANNTPTSATAPASNDAIDSITPITSNASTPTAGAAGCSINSLNNNESKGCSVESSSNATGVVEKKEAL